MKQTSKRAIQDSSKHIHAYYEFLLERGYELISAEDAFLGWQATLRKADLFIRILYTRDEEYVSFGTGPQLPDEFTDMEIVLNAMTGEKNAVSWKNHARDLQKHIDQIETYFAVEYVKNPEGLLAAVQEFNDSLPKPETYVPEGSSTPQGSKKIPILHYPLMGIILLLIFFFLATLCGVVVDRLFAVFSP